MASVNTFLDGAVGTITLNRPEKHNALSASLAGDLLEGLRGLVDEGARVVVLRATQGAQIWSTGHDPNELLADGRGASSHDDPLRRVACAIQESPAPTIAMVEGGVWDGACEIVMSCDMVIAAEGATFAITPATLGGAYDLASAVNFLQSLSPPIVKEMLLTARPISADRALRLGLVNEVVPAECLEGVTADLAARILQNSPAVISLIKESVGFLAEAQPINSEAFRALRVIGRGMQKNSLKNRNSGHSQVTPLPLGKNHEARANGDFASNGAPAVFLANVGTPSEFKARTKYALSIFQAGGFRALTNDGFADGHAAAIGFAESDARIAVICSSDMKYEDVAEDTAAELKAAGARTVILVGDPGLREERYCEAGVDRFISTNCDVLAMLRDLHIEEECRASAISEFKDVA